MVKSKYIWIIVLVALGLIGFQFYNLEHPGNFGAPYNEFSGIKVPSPERSKFAQITSDSSDISLNAQVLINFGYPNSPSGSGVFSVMYNTGGIGVEWMSDDHLWIIYPENSKVIFQDTQIQFFNESVKISYDTYIVE